MSELTFVLCHSASLLPAAPAWGPPSDGLAIDVDSDLAAGRLVVLFRSVGASMPEFVAGGATGVGILYTIEFVSSAPDGTECRLLNTTVGAVAGVVVPIVARVYPGIDDRVSVDLRKLICTSRGNQHVGTLLKRGHSVRATLKVTAQSNDWGRVPGGWTGSAVSGWFPSPAKPPASVSGQWIGAFESDLPGRRSPVALTLDLHQKGTLLEGLASFGNEPVRRMVTGEIRSNEVRLSTVYAGWPVEPHARWLETQCTVRGCDNALSLRGPGHHLPEVLRRVPPECSDEGPV